MSCLTIGYLTIPVWFVPGHRTARYPALVALLFTSWVNVQNTLYGEEPCEAFLQALIEKQYFDVAYEYLDVMQGSELAGTEFNRRIPLFRVSILLDEASSIRDPQRVTGQLDKTEQVLDQFIAGNPSADLLAEAQEQRANISMGRARRLLDQASSDRITIQQQGELREQARTYLKASSDTFDSIRDRLRSELENFKVDPQDPNSNDRLDRLRNDYIKIRLKSPRVKEQVADSYDRNDPQAKTMYEQAAKEFDELFEKYRTRLSGVDGRLGAARCYQKLGDSKKALIYLLDVWDLPLGQLQNQKKREAALVAIDAWNSIDPYPAQDAFTRLQPLVYSIPPDFARTSDGLRLRLEFAKICNKLATMIEETGPSTAEERKQMVLLDKEAANIARALSRVSGPFRDEAKQLLVEWGNRITEDPTAPDVANLAPPATFTEARQRGIDIQLSVADLKSTLTSKQDQAADSDDSENKTVADEISELQSQIRSRSNDALRMFDLALTLAAPDIAADDIAGVRHRQAISYFQMERFFETAIIGEFLADRFADNTGTQPAVGLVCKSYWQLYIEARKRTGEAAVDASFELQQLKKYCQLVFDKWPGTDEAEAAGIIMMQVSLDQNDAIAADKYLSEVPEASTTRARAVLDVGNQLWREYVIRQQKGNVDAALRQKAQKLLETGVGYLDIETIGPYHARSALSLTELYLDAGDADAALNQLEFAKIAPLDLVKNKHAAANDTRYRRDVFRTAIRVYLAKLRDGKDSLEWVEKSRGVLEALKQEIGDQPDGKKQLTSIYLTLSRELKQQFDSLETNEQREAFAEGLSSFLSSLAEHADDPQLMMLTGTMLTDIGASLKQQGLTSQAARFFEKAVGVYQTLSQSPNADPKIQLAILRGQANALRGTGKFEEAIKLFGDILEDPTNQRYVDLQVDAAMTLAEWGLEKNDVTALVEAVQGGVKRNGKSTVMGWTQLAKIARRDKSASSFAEAIYYIAKCKFQYGKLKSQPGMCDAAIEEIVKFSQNDPELGGPLWKPRLEKLLSDLRSQ